MLRSMQKKEGFTLVELLIVVAIIGILAAIAIPQFAAYREKAYCSAAKSDLANLAVSEEAWYTDNDAYLGAQAIAPGAAPAEGATTGFVASSGVTVTLAAPALTSWTATAAHTNCSVGGPANDGVMSWDSALGGLQ